MKRKSGQPHKGWKASAKQARRRQVTIPIARTEPSCFSDVDGFPMSQRGAHAAQGDGSAKIGVGDGAASCELKAPFASPVTLALSRPPSNSEAK